MHLEDSSSTFTVYTLFFHPLLFYVTSQLPACLQWTKIKTKHNTISGHCKQRIWLHTYILKLSCMSRAGKILPNSPCTDFDLHYHTSSAYRQYWAHLWMVSTIWGNKALTLSLIRSWKKCIASSSSRSSRNFSWSWSMHHTKERNKSFRLLC